MNIKSSENVSVNKDLAVTTFNTIEELIESKANENESYDENESEDIWNYHKIAA